LWSNPCLADQGPGRAEALHRRSRTTPLGSIIDGAITKAGGTRAALLTGAAACLAAAFIASLVRTPPHPDAALTDLVQPSGERPS
jgi:hypothetical protein